MVSQNNNVNNASNATVFGQPDVGTLRAIDQIADQMLMPRSWVVTQILREWAERRNAEIHALEESWNGSYREVLSACGCNEAQ